MAILEINQFSAIEENCLYKKDMSIEFDPYRSFVLDWLIVSDIVWLQLVCQGQATYYMLELEFNLCQSIANVDV